MGALLIAGTGSGVGKSTVVAGLCRWYARRGNSVAPSKAQNPGSDTRAQVVVMGRAVGEYEASAYWTGDRPPLLEVACDAFADLRRRSDVVLCEGAGSPAEINLRSRDIVNLGFARATGTPVVVVGDIDPGGVFASLVGTCFAAVRQARFDRLAALAALAEAGPPRLPTLRPSLRG